MSADGVTKPVATFSTAQSGVNSDWASELFHDRRAVVAQVPSMPAKALRPNLAMVLRVFLFLLVLCIAVAGGLILGSVSGRWWVGLLVSLIIGWVALLLGIGLIGAFKVEREARTRRDERAREDPIGRLLPSRGVGRRILRDPASYRALLALPDRPTLVLDRALFEQKSPGAIGALARRGRMPEPEVLETSNVPAGIWILGLILPIQTIGLWTPLLESYTAGAPIVWWNWFGLVPPVLGLYLVVRDPFIRRKLGLSGFFGRDAIIGAGWIVDKSGRTWTVDDTVVLVTAQGGGVEVRLLHRERVLAFFLPVMLTKRTGRGFEKPKPRALRGHAKALVVEAIAGSAEAVGIGLNQPPDDEMPGPDEPLRLLLSSWTYPEPRPDLAMTERG